MEGDRINKDTIVRNRFHRGKSRNGIEIEEIVIHGTAGPNTLSFVRSGVRKSEYIRAVGLFHYLIERDGTIWEIIEPDRWVYHSQRGDKDISTIGIELENPSFDNSAEYTPQQYDSLFYLLEYLFKRYPTIDTIMSHSRSYQKYVGGEKKPPCPGPKFQWKLLENFLVAIGKKWKHTDPYESYWDIS